MAALPLVEREWQLSTRCTTGSERSGQRLRVVSRRDDRPLPATSRHPAKSPIAAVCGPRIRHADHAFGTPLRTPVGG